MFEELRGRSNTDIEYSKRIGKDSVALARLEDKHQMELLTTKRELKEEIQQMVEKLNEDTMKVNKILAEVGTSPSRSN